jgi:hypothetical protein
VTGRKGEDARIVRGCTGEPKKRQTLLPAIECRAGAAFPGAELVNRQTAGLLASDAIAPEVYALGIWFSCHALVS